MRHVCSSMSSSDRFPGKLPCRGPSIIVLALLGVAIPAVVVPVEAQNPDACSAPEHRQFDFWVGEWSVSRVADDQVVASSRITSVLNGCAVHEDYKTQGGYAGYSYSAYDRVAGQWHQTWVDVGGLVLKIDGGIENGSMVLRGTGVNQTGDEILNEVTWTPHDDGTVQQTWRQSADGGETWTTAFNGRYRRASD